MQPASRGHACPRSGAHAAPARVRWYAYRMPPRLRTALAFASLLLALLACGPSAVTSLEPGRQLPAFDPRLAARGPIATSVTSDALRSAFGCLVRYEVHTPDAWHGGATVVLAHGFLRNLASMRGWAEHLASHGVRTAVVSFCNSTLFAGHHDRNALDLRAVADALPAPEASTARVLYAGFSAGGLAALLAAAEDPAAVAYLGLDPVDSGGLAAGATEWQGPALFLFAEPSPCNAEGNMRPFADRLASARVVSVTHATHCHFEDPYASACERLCGRVDPPEAALAIRDAIRSQATAFVLQHAGRAPR